MIPIKLHLAGFLSYQDAVDLSFDGFDLACISGHNGAGKSSLLEAITWVLFGQARGREDEALINKSGIVKAAEVVFDFEYEGNVYRVQRCKPRGKATILEVFVLSPGNAWRPLTEKSVRETELKLRQTLRLDYDTFINASFFLQGKADQFAQQNPANRKKVLSSILGLEVWETYRFQAAEQRKLIESDLRAVDTQLAEIENELAQESERKARLDEIETRLKQLNDQRLAREAALEAVRRLAASLNEQKRLLDVLGSRLSETRGRKERLDQLFEVLLVERDTAQFKIQMAEEIRDEYRKWQIARENLARWEQTAASFHLLQTRRAGPLSAIAAVRSRLEEEKRGLKQKTDQSQRDRLQLDELKSELPRVEKQIRDVHARLAERTAFEEEMLLVQQQNADLEAENRRLRPEMATLKERIDRLKQALGADCALCGQPLNSDERGALIVRLESEGKLMGDAFRGNQRLIEMATQKQKELSARLVDFTKYEEDLRQLTRRSDQIETEIYRLESALQACAAEDEPRLRQIERDLLEETYAVEERADLAVIDAEARSVGYDTEAHDACRRDENELRSAEQKLRDLEKALAALEPLQRQIGDVEIQREKERSALASQENEYQAAEEKYRRDLIGMPDLDLAEREAMAVQVEENRLRMETGMVRQLVSILEVQRERKVKLRNEREAITKSISRLKILERAFGKDGIPALLIEQALPEIEAQANDMLDRLTAGGMSVRFNTQRQLKSKDEKRETLDILISDSSGEREYEMFSGGEAFRVDFAMRLALSRVLAHRAGARLQTLFIDEGFGSQDAYGKQRLMEAINLVRPEFAKILVITHLEEMKDQFPARIEVEKTLQGSRVRILS
jgi:exonuclease SbcC